MTVKSDILDFLRSPVDFSATVTDPEVWLAALEAVAIPSIEALGDRALRPAQEAAWRGLAQNRVGLILGPPGTGKTHLLSWLIMAYAIARQREARPGRVFVSAFTRNAVVNVLEGVAKRQAMHDPEAPEPIYYGTPPAGGLPAGIRHIHAGNEDEVLAQIASGRVVVGGTIWSLYRLLGTGKAPGGDSKMTAPLFDLICIDEASQVVLGQGLMALAGMAEGCRLVVAGDDRQLPPIRAARPTEASGRDLGGSLYAFLKSASVAEFALEETFRLNAPLTEFAQANFYDDTYVSAAPDERLALTPDWEAGLDSIARIALDPAYPIVVLLHDGPSASTSNPFEAALTARLAEALSERAVDSAGETRSAEAFWAEGLAIVSPHRAQNAAIRAALPRRLKENAFVETVDRIQGKERDAVILSYCVADSEFALVEGDFIFSPERLNVATTRAKTKLIVLISRRLVEITPAEQEIVDKAELLRKFVFECGEFTQVETAAPSGRAIHLEVRVKAFDGETPEFVSHEDPVVEAAPVEMTPVLEAVLAGIRDVASRDGFGSAALSKVRKALAMPHDPFEEARQLHLMGWVSLDRMEGRFGAFWTARPFDAPRRVFVADEETVRSRLAGVVRDARSGRHAFYNKVRDRFGWMTTGETDAFLPIIHKLEAEGLVRLVPLNKSVAVEMVDQGSAEEIAPPDPEVRLADEDYQLLNALEDFEAGRLNFGVFDGWTSLNELMRLGGLTLEEATAAVSRLEANGHLMMADGSRLRSRMAEIARELRHVKQRFRSDDAGRRPYLTRSLKVELRTRAKPTRNQPLATVFEAASAGREPLQALALAGLRETLERLWGDGAALAGFQARGLGEILDAWNGQGASAIAIAADTGSGKTEAAVLPIIAGALADRMAGIEGVRAILAYPRIRLAANQAQRLAEYLAACAETPGLPLLTLGLQVGAVPQTFDAIHPEMARDWQPAGAGAFVFPFFACPRCGGALTLRVGDGHDGVDALVCTAGDWRFNGWVGSKSLMKTRPPAIFLPTTDSLHQWMHNPEYGRLFGDDAGFAPPRLLLADEIHLYTHIHGSQVGWTLRRLAGRAETNMPSQGPMVMVGMSATIGDPAGAWGRLVGRGEVGIVRPEAGESEINPRGREYFYFIQPEIESRGSDISGASTTIQSLMCLGHSVRRRTGSEGGYRSLVFFDSIDKMRRLHGAFVDAEEGRELAAFRTVDFGEDPAGDPQAACCKDPIGCDRFSDGECWWFAANDERQQSAHGVAPPGRPLKVAGSPIYSGTSSEAESLIKGSDVVFATSSLEVGYDDPDITLVYQHYAPQNLASFIQRKGRGGRGVDDRPNTAVTLSLYSPRDAWWFRRPDEMISPVGFDMPLNIGNAFVRRGQVLSTLMDGLARWERGASRPALSPDGRVEPAALLAGGDLVEAVFGDDVWSGFGVSDVSGFWRAATAGAVLDGPSLARVRSQLAWAPNALFDSINLPTVDVTGVDVYGGARQDISLALSTLAPGNATRRFEPRAVHWREPYQGPAPWFDHADYATAEFTSLGADPAAVLADLPKDVRAGLEGLSPELCRPTSVTLNKIGWMAGSFWNAEARFGDGVSAPAGPVTTGGTELSHDSRGDLRGFVVVSAIPDRGRVLNPDLVRGVQSVAVFSGDAIGQGGSGLRAARAYWGADALVKFADPEVDPVAVAQTFVHPETRAPLLHGFIVETEGLQVQVDRAALDAFIEAQLSGPGALEQDLVWRRRQALRFFVESMARGAGLNGYEAERGANLIAAIGEVPDLKAKLLRLSRFWSGDRLASLFEDARQQCFAHHPLMTPTRVARAAEAFASDALREVVTRALAEAERPEAVRSHLRSLVLHGLAIRLRRLVSHVGQGDDRRLLFHARLPLQFDQTDDLVTVCEAGAHGDGTIRAVETSWDEVRALWAGGFIAACPNAEEDALVERFWGMSDQHAGWRAQDPRDPRVLSSIGDALSGRLEPPPTSVVRILFDVETVSAEPVTFYDLAAELRGLRDEIILARGRPPLDWEIAGAAVAKAQQGGETPLSRLYAAYQTLDDVGEGAFSPEARLADQAYRLAAPLCVDGCRGCVHQSSDVMADSLVESSVSRRALAAFFGA